MNNQQTIEKTRAFIEQKFSGGEGAHDYFHMYRVWQLARHILKDEPTADPLLTELSALLHDIADWKFTDGDEEAGPRAARAWLESIDVSETTILQIENIIRHVSFKGANVASKMESLEGKIVSDADKLDAMGAIGIGRTFTYGGSKGRAMYDPGRPAQDHKDAASYMKNDGPTLNHFYEKMLLLKDRMFTEAGKQMALHRHAYMEQFLAEFYDEWDGKR